MSRYAPDPDAPLCSSGKRPFRTEELARAQLAQARRLTESGTRAARRPGRTETRVYQCPVCRWWHLTAQRKRGRL